MNKLNDQDLEKVAGGITEKQALDAALKHAGFTEDQLDFVKKVELDWEHGKKVYEIEFYKGGYEYEFDIDAASGSILKYKKDWD